MAYQYGSIDLGIRNPFRLEGAIRASGGLVIAGLGLWLLLGIAELVRIDWTAGIINAALGFLLLATGLGLLATGLFHAMRFFVGRSVPTSLAPNYSRSERDSAPLEAADIQYSASKIEQMLMGRKNLTFKEPLGWISRLVHSLFPRLTFLPWPMRNIAQRLAAACIKTGIAVTAFALTWFTAVTGLSGSAGRDIVPIFSLALLAYLLVVWFRVGHRIERKEALHMQTTGSRTIAWILALAILLPVGLGILYDAVIAPLLAESPRASAYWSDFKAAMAGFSPGLYILAIGGIAAICSAALFTMIGARSREAQPITEVSELRDNWQESVHPREIFINIDNIVMANRRYREVPNRVYNDKEPELEEQTQGKGTFWGELIQETQPVFKPVEHNSAFRVSRLITTLTAQVLIIAAASFAVAAGGFSGETIQNYRTTNVMGWELLQMVASSAALFKLLMGTLICAIFGLALLRLAHFFWGEMLFESLLIYFKCEGTFTESQLSTGTSIYDSTRSENVLVRSSITPWVIVSRIVSSTFAGVGRRNLEWPRQVLEMRRDDDELRAIIDDLKGFLGGREAIASIKNEKDLSAASNIFQINQQTRAHSEAGRLEQEAEHAGGALSQIEQDRTGK